MSIEAGDPQVKSQLDEVSFVTHVIYGVRILESKKLGFHIVYNKTFFHSGDTDRFPCHLTVTYDQGGLLIFCVYI